jgi:phage N-6-adenine-methyltransferase
MERKRKGSRQDWRTPREFIEAMYLAGMGPYIDVMADEENAVCTNFWTKERDALSDIWPLYAYCNPPFNLISDVVTHLEQGRFVHTCYLLTPNSTETKWFQRLAKLDGQCLFLAPRLNFTHPDEKGSGAGFGCVLWVIKKDQLIPGMRYGHWNWKETLG